MPNVINGIKGANVITLLDTMAHIFLKSLPYFYYFANFNSIIVKNRQWATETMEWPESKNFASSMSATQFAKSWAYPISMRFCLPWRTTGLIKVRSYICLMSTESNRYLNTTQTATTAHLSEVQSFHLLAQNMIDTKTKMRLVREHRHSRRRVHRPVLVYNLISRLRANQQN